MLESVENKRLTVQLAADAGWPHTEEQHAGVRKEFALPMKRPVV